MQTPTQPTLSDEALTQAAGGVGDALPAGLDSAEAARRLARFGPNRVAVKPRPAWKAYLAKFWAPVPWLLEAAMLAQVALGKHVEAALIGVLLLFNASLSFLQEGRAGAALAALERRLTPTAIVRRDGRWRRIPGADVVPGDVIALALGGQVPADATILSGSLLLDRSMLTGESVPVEAARDDTADAGALVRRGEAIAEVARTGAGTRLGRTAALVSSARAASTEQAAVFAATRSLALANGSLAVAMVLYAHWLGLAGDDLLGLALTALLGTIPVALPATFTLAGALGASALAQRGVLLTRLSAAHEAAAMDVLCADKTGTLTRNVLEVAEITAMPGFDRGRVLGLAAVASSQAGQDPIDTAVGAAADSLGARPADLRRTGFVPFDPATKVAEALALDEAGRDLRIVKGAFGAIAAIAEGPPDARRLVDELAGRGNRVIAVAAGPPRALRLAGLVAIADPPRQDSAALVGTLASLGVRTVMVTGDSAATAASIARQVGIEGAVCPPGQPLDAGMEAGTDAASWGVFARMLPERKHALVRALQSAGHVVGMCGDGTNDAPALRQAQIGIAVSTATDVAKAAAGMVMTEPGLAGIVSTVEEGRVGFQRLLTYTLNMLVKKLEIVLFLTIGLLVTGQPVLTPALMVLLFVTNDFLMMSLTTDRAMPGPRPARWNMGPIVKSAALLAACKLAFSTAVLAWGQLRLALAPAQIQTLAFLALAFGNQALVLALRERRRLWSSRPSGWVLLSSTADVATVSALALSGTLVAPLPWTLCAATLAAAAGFALLLDAAKTRILAAFRIG